MLAKYLLRSDSQYGAQPTQQAAKKGMALPQASGYDSCMWRGVGLSTGGQALAAEALLTEFQALLPTPPQSKWGLIRLHCRKMEVTDMVRS